ncbi:MAG: hypothetical protein K8R74_03960, partial [Bacteroidales bacterium]|nr:hypothetical protein [Bacteroidales bacterium]
CVNAIYKQVYDERIFIIDNYLKIPLYPTAPEIYIYENKRFLYTWLKANNLPHPETYVFCTKLAAKTYATQADFPIVAKTNIGAAGSGVRILQDKSEALSYIEQSFSSKGAPRRWGPNLSKGNLIKRGYHYVLKPSDIRKKTSKYKAAKADKQKGFVILQEYIHHEFEWRVVRIGDSLFAHKKLKIGEKASGTTLKKYENPPISLFDFVYEITQEHGFFSQAVDVFETHNGYLINEMQCIFGQSDPYQMLVDDKPGRYVLQRHQWVFERGDFNTYESYDLRLKVAIELFKQKKI